MGSSRRTCELGAQRPSVPQFETLDSISLDGRPQASRFVVFSATPEMLRFLRSMMNSFLSLLKNHRHCHVPWQCICAFPRDVWGAFGACVFVSWFVCFTVLRHVNHVTHFLGLMTHVNVTLLLESLSSKVRANALAKSLF